jgi:8-oxo-dGTP pyrophosphatase MutT (NUDIX family)
VTAGPAAVGGDAPADLPGLIRRYPVLAPPVPTAGAAVTIVLRAGAEEIEVLLIVRATNPGDPASGQVGLPGGHVSGEDVNLAATAVRELEEEVGLTAGDLDGPLHFVGTTFARRFGIHVAVFAAGLGERSSVPAARSLKEVAHVYWLPRSALSVTRMVAQDTPAGAREVAATVSNGRVLWGFTRRVLRDFFGFPPEDELGGPAIPPTKS